MGKKDVQNDDINDTLDDETDETLERELEEAENASPRSHRAKQYAARKRLEALQEEAKLRKWLDMDYYAFEDIRDEDE